MVTDPEGYSQNAIRAYPCNPWLFSCSKPVAATTSITNFVRPNLTYGSTEVRVDVDPSFFLEGFQAGVGDELGSGSVIEARHGVALFDDG